MKKIITTQDGSHSIYSEKFGEAYHSKYGAIQEAQHVFIEAGFQAIKATTDEVHLLEMGMGTGLNALMTYIENQKQPATIYYTGIEAHPIDNWQDLNYINALKADKDAVDFFNQLHQVNWETQHQVAENFYIEKKQTLLQDITLPSQYFNLVYFDAFAPTAQAELWTADIFQKIHNSMQLGGILTTYCAKGSVKRALKSVGFTLEALPGPIGKREMTRAIKQ